MVSTWSPEWEEGHRVRAAAAHAPSDAGKSSTSLSMIVEELEVEVVRKKSRITAISAASHSVMRDCMSRAVTPLSATKRRSRKGGEVAF